MTLKLTIDVPNALAQQAKEAGLLNSESVADWLREEVRRRQAAMGLKKVLDKVRGQPGRPMSMKEILAEIKAERRARETGS